MNRRNAIKNIGFFTGGMVILPSCNFSEEQVSLALNNLQITIEQQKLLEAVVTTYIPEGDIPGAQSLNVSNFVWVMVDDCLTKEKQDLFLIGMNQFEAMVMANKNKSFRDLTSNQRESTLLEMTELKEKSNLQKGSNEIQAIKNFINTSKNLTVWGYKQSAYMMTEIMPYTLVPGTYSLCETIDNSKKINVNA